MMIGLPAMVYPSGSNARTFERLPSWKIQTSAPKLALIDSRVMITALTGMISEPKSRNRISAAREQGQPHRPWRSFALGDQEVVGGRGAAADLGRDPVARVECRG